MSRTLYSFLFFGTRIEEEIVSHDLLAKRYLGVIGWNGDLDQAAEAMSEWPTPPTPTVYVPTGSNFAQRGAFIASTGSVAVGEWWRGGTVDPDWMLRDDATLARWRADILAFQDATRLPREEPRWQLTAYEI